MQLDAPTFLDGFRFGFIVGIGASLLLGGVSCGYWLVMRPISTSRRELKSMAASASK
jgi:hypothetical protein